MTVEEIKEKFAIDSQKLEGYLVSIKQSFSNIQSLKTDIHTEMQRISDLYSPYPYMGRFLERSAEKLEEEVTGYQHTIFHQLGCIILDHYCPNVGADFDHSAREYFKNNDFNIDKIIQALIDEYLAKAPEKAYNELLKLSKQLLPYRNASTRNGDKLLLHSSTEPMFHDKNRFYGRDTVTRLTALEHLIAALIDQMPPQSVIVTNIKKSIGDDPWYGGHVVSNSHIKNVRFFKNGNIQIMMDSEQNASKIEEALKK